MFFVATAGIANLATMGFVRYIKLCVPTLGKAKMMYVFPVWLRLMFSIYVPSPCKANVLSFIAKIKMKYVCLCVCPLTKYLTKMLNRSTSFLV